MYEQNRVDVLFSGNADALERAQGKLNRWPKEYSDQLRQLGQAYQELGRQHDATIKRLEQQRGPGAAAHFGTWQKIQQQAQAEDAARRQTLATQVWDTTLRGQRAAGHEQQMATLGNFFAAIQTGTGTLGRWSAAMLGVDASLLGLGAVVQTVRSELEAFGTRMQQAASAQLSEATQLSNFLEHAGVGRDMTPAEVQAWGQKMKRAGFTPADVWGVASAPASSRPQGAPLRGSLEAAEAVMTTYPYAAHDVKKTMAGAVQRIRGMYGGTAEEVTGFVIGAQEQSQLEGPSSWAHYGSQALASLKQLYPQISAEEGANLFNTMGQLMQDPFGRTTRTALIRWALQLQASTKDRPEQTPAAILRWMQTTPEGKLRAERVLSGTGLPEDELLAGLTRLEKAKALGEVDALELKSWSGEAQAIPAWRALQAMTPEELAKKQALLPSLGPASAAVREQVIEQQRQYDAIRTAEAERAARGGAQQAINEDSLNAVRGTLLEQFTKQQSQDDTRWQWQKWGDYARVQTALAYANTPKQAQYLMLGEYLLQERLARQNVGGERGERMAESWETARRNLSREAGIPFVEDTPTNRQRVAAPPANAPPPAAPGVNDQGAVELQKQTGLLAQMVGLLQALPEALGAGSGGVGPGPQVATGSAAMG